MANVRRTTQYIDLTEVNDDLVRMASIPQDLKMFAREMSHILFRGGLTHVGQQELRERMYTTQLVLDWLKERTND